jgi:hypothetical protein
MKKQTLSFLLCFVALGLSGYKTSSTLASSSAPQAARIVFPKIDRHPAADSWQRGSLMSIPAYDPDSHNQWQMDLRSYDLSGLDLRQSLNDLMYAEFDARTRWPTADKLPPGFDWQKIMELGKNPGLGIRSLHARGITGRGVGLAVIDQPLLVDHQEYAGQMQLYEEINVASNRASEMHGPAVASIAAGKTIGVAPEADLYYIGCYAGDFSAGNSFTNNFHYIAQGIQRILDINRQLPKDRKIRVISISVGWDPKDKGCDEVTAAVKKAKAAGLLVVSSNLEESFGFRFQGLGRAPLADPDKFELYEPALNWAKNFHAGEKSPVQLLVPMDSRTTASPGGTGEYVFYRRGAWSWAIPYVAGVYALAAQVKPTLTPDEFWSAAMKTGRTIEREHDGKTVPFGPILDPVALVAALQTK